MNFEHIPSQPKPSARELSKKDFSFTAEDVIREFKHGKKMEYIGTGTSDFQAHPGLLDENGQPMSDWEISVQDSLQQNSNKKHTPEQLAELPRFFDKTDEYAKRSQEIGMNMFRLSFDFARLCPEPGKFDEKKMSEYVKALALLKARGQEPLVAMYHWTMPKYLLKFGKNNEIESGGWENPEAAAHFTSYVQNVVKFLGDDDKIRKVLDESGFDKRDQDKFLAEGLVKNFLTINEPSTLILDSYVAGIFPPYKNFSPKLVEVGKKLIEMHDMTLNELKTGLKKGNGTEAQVGIAHNWNYFDGALGGILQKINKGLTKGFEGDGSKTDFLALQYYCRVSSILARPLIDRKIKGQEYGDHPGFGSIYPPGIYEHLKSMNKMYPNKEIFITEFGFSDARDKKRPFWILETMRYVLEAKKAGIPIKGMLLWSLVNNFEWDRGMDQQFGLFAEKDLSQPLQPSGKGDIRSWEAWQSVARAILQPTDDNIQKLQRAYETAKQLHTAADY